MVLLFSLFLGDIIIAMKTGEVNMNNEGFIYINSGLRLNAINIAIMRTLNRQSEELLVNGERCQTNECIK